MQNNYMPISKVIKDTVLSTFNWKRLKLCGMWLGDMELMNNSLDEDVDRNNSNKSSSSSNSRVDFTKEISNMLKYVKIKK